MRTEPIIHTHNTYIGDLRFDFRGEQWDNEILDTEVKIDGKQLCWISWQTKDEFIIELTNIVEKHRI